MSSWRKAGLTYNSYLSVAAKVIRSALKPELQTAAVMNRSKSEGRYVKYENGSAVTDSAPLNDK
ncbi:hypothetical protein HG535_0G03100 [Zygotorulaspora mrakii]|uniref:Uncharacterized protein n=1 Tax=Zygotorulaspora mrakii TaxID=42260 RepID=A0A7H9B764_ZYGMR|nr:uncharacterized protein HG535_0G03100 [Zygotorulaspora mrakii]QLG74427.1 hypothetical protein HG535_0G03100 [Zygotorulaspora mrakii]